MNFDKNQQKSMETKKKIYQSAEQLFRENDFANVSVDAIVEKAGISKGAFYVHFDSKDSLISAFIEDAVAKVDVAYKTILASFSDDTPTSDIIFALLDIIAYNIMEVFGYSLIKNACLIQLNRTHNAEVMLCFKREIYETFRKLFSRGFERKEFKTDKSLDAITDIFATEVRGLIFEWCARYPEFDLKEHLRDHFEILLAGIKR